MVSPINIGSAGAAMLSTDTCDTGRPTALKITTRSGVNQQTAAVTVPQSPVNRSFWLVDILSDGHLPGCDASTGMGANAAVSTRRVSSSDRIAQLKEGATWLFPS